MNPLPPAYCWLDDLSPLPRMLEEARKLYGTFEVPGPASNPLIIDWAKEVGMAGTSALFIPEHHGLPHLH